ncbi:MAG: serine hydrolase [Limisphaerales bacterium]
MIIWNRLAFVVQLVCFGSFLSLGCIDVASAQPKSEYKQYVLGFDTKVDPALQSAIEKIDSELRTRFEIESDKVSVGVLDLRTLRLAMVNPDRGDYAASVPKIGILLAYFQLHPEAVTNLDKQTRQELGLMAKASNNETAAKFSREMGLKEIQKVLNSYHFYDEKRGGGIWVGKHYGKGDERYGDPLGDNSHAATARQLLRFYLLLEQEKLVSPAASKEMRKIFESPEIPHDNIKFVKGLADRELKIIRKWGSWRNWLHDSAVINGTGRHYILVGMTQHAKGDDYLVELSQRVDDLMNPGADK